MKDLLDLLTARELEAGEESLRLALLKFNGLAALCFIQYEVPRTRPANNENDQRFFLQWTIDVYEQVLEIAKNQENSFHVDSFQLAHAFYNLSLALNLAAEKDFRVLRFRRRKKNEATNRFSFSVVGRAKTLE